MTESHLIALVLDDGDNVATLLGDAKAGDCVGLKGNDTTITITDNIDYGHKVALTKISKGTDITKYGHRIGKATKEIEAGSWVHLHNMASAIDETFKKRIDSCSASQ